MVVGKKTYRLHTKFPDFSLTGKCLPIFPGFPVFPVRLGTLNAYLVQIENFKILALSQWEYHHSSPMEKFSISSMGI